MNRKLIDPRSNWKKIVEDQGLLFHSPGSIYWNESACYQFTAKQIDELEAATNALHEMSLAAVQHVIDKERFDELKIPSAAVPMIIKSWNESHPALHGRFDLAYDGKGPAKMLEYNADTPTSLLEAAVIQWYWLKDVFPSADQFNSIHDKLVAKWKDLQPYLDGERVHFAHMNDIEDLFTVTYLRETAQQAGLKTEGVHIKEIGSDGAAFFDEQKKRIHTIYKLYPWEWMIHEEFGPQLLSTYSEMQWIEPLWKMILSNKGILAILWELFPNHENLLPAKIGAPITAEFCKKPLLSREGANVSLHTKAGISSTDGDYGEEGFVYQAIANVPCFDGNYPIIGSWYVLDQGAAGIGIRESDGPITGNLARFVPHYFE